ncbi:MAG: CHASE3 domain-containing protein [Dokdonella sp.]
MLPAMGLLLVGGMVDRTMDDFVEQSTLVAHTLEVKQKVVVTVATLRDAEAAQRAYVISGLPDRLGDYYGAMPKLTENLQQLAGLVSDNPEQSAAVQSLQATVAIRTANMATLLDAFQRGGIDAFRRATQLATSRQEDRAFDVASTAMLAKEDKLLEQRQQSTLRTAHRTTLLTLGAIGLSFATMMLALLLVLREQRRRLASEADVRRSNQQLAEALADAHQLSHTLRQLSALGETLQGCQSLDEAVAGLQVVLPTLLPQVSGSINLIDDEQPLVQTLARWGDHVAPMATFSADAC